MTIPEICDFIWYRLRKEDKFVFVFPISVLLESEIECKWAADNLSYALGPYLLCTCLCTEMFSFSIAMFITSE